MTRVARGLGALLGLLLGLVGVPAALLVLGASVWPGSWSATAVVEALLRPDDGRMLAALLTVVGWAAWAVFAASVLVEALQLIGRGRPRIAIPGLAAPQRLAAALLLAVIALMPTAQTVHAAPPQPTAAPSAPATDPPPVGVTAPDENPSTPTTDPPAAPSAAAHAKPHAAPSSVVHRVREGDDLWSLAEHYYGDGMDWRKIAKANQHVLTGGPDRLLPGWKLTIPGVTAAEPESRRTAVESDRRTVTVHRGDTLSSIAERELGSEARWPELFRANRSLLQDPDELEVGTTLVVPGATADRTTSTSPGGRQTIDPSTDEQAGSDQPQPDHTTGTNQPAPDHTTRTNQPAPDHTRADRDGEPEPAADRPSDDRVRGTDTAVDPTAQLDQRSRSVRDAGSGAKAGPDDRTASQPTTSQPTTSQQTTSQQTTSQQTTSQPTISQPASDVPLRAPAAERTDRPAAQADAKAVTEDDSAVPVPMGVYAGVGGLLAAGVIGGLAYRRRLQLQARPVGRRILHAEPQTAAAEVALGAVQRPLDAQSIDVAQRALAAYCRSTDTPVPELSLVTLDDESLTLRLDRGAGEPPLGFQQQPDGWRVDRGDAAYLASLPRLVDAVRPYPALAELGRARTGERVLANLEQLGLLSLRGDPDRAAELLSALAVELSFGPAADELILTIVGDGSGLPDALDKHNVTVTADVDLLLDRLEARAQAQRDQRPDGPAGHFRIDPNLSDPWAPEVVLFRDELRDDQQRRLLRLVQLDPPPTLAVVAADAIPGAPWTLVLPAGAESEATLEPLGLELVPQRLCADAEQAVVGLVAASGSLDTTPAPWWVDTDDPPGPPPDNLAYLARRSAGWADGIDTQNGQNMTQNPEIGRDVPPDHPVLLMLGPIELVGAQGELPSRAAKQCLEYCGWLLEHPGTTAQAMGAALLVAEGTRRSNMSRLRSWLGAGPDGQAYLPDAYSGRILLHATVSSDWLRLQILTAGGVNRCSDNGLRSALDLVRGAPLADAAPGQWHWAEELRTDMISAVRDIGVELGRRANEAGDLDLARWAAARALAAAPGDELLMATRIRTEHLAGNRAETERLTLQLAAQARTLGVDLDQATVELLQEVMEGRVRARLA
ncbi:LysM peptidoglycan-binding domain-containing protein [Microlunatus ginsengisoli]|uniref:BTAD domain-containing putative transcriptional regulator n=1 Tax=Microlunatus ginsengisoli TaxID=363863 RepID=A0ABP6ZZS3_9ACTN